jgi:hypothetical protein
MAKQQRRTGGQAGRVKDAARDGRLKANRDRGINMGTTRNKKKA